MATLGFPGIAGMFFQGPQPRTPPKEPWHSELVGAAAHWTRLSAASMALPSRETSPVLSFLHPSEEPEVPPVDLNDSVEDLVATAPQFMTVGEMLFFDDCAEAALAEDLCREIGDTWDVPAHVDAAIEALLTDVLSLVSPGGKYPVNMRDLRSLITPLVAKCDLDLSVFVVAALYLRKAVSTDNVNRLTLTSDNILKVLVAVIAVSSKFVTDKDFTNKQFADFAGLVPSDVNEGELSLLKALDWNIFVKKAAYISALNSLRSCMPADQFNDLTRPHSPSSLELSWQE
eukprot:GFYU01001074.1.p1 GENE.GFYU01001074.1~~GFYU01001074.1.p1  ORF type:complete len:287 (+),score=72.91 GFYU01001074.1:201-1061(+)